MMKRNSSSRLFVGALLAMASTSVVASGPGSFFGYFANNTYIPENYDHTNVTFVWAGYTDRHVATNVILQELGQARVRGVKAVVEVSAIVFSNGCSNQPNAASQWAEFVNALTSAGHLSPGNPAGSTIAAFYPVDEPELCGLADIGSAPNPGLANAVNAIRNHPSTANFPIGVIASSQWSTAIRGLRLFNWVGMDDYGASTASYLSAMTSLSGQLNSGQRIVLVPQASEGGFVATYGTSHEPDPVYQRWASDPKVIGIMPFLWGHAETTGVRGLPTLRNRYTVIGKHIAKGGPAPLMASASCAHAGGGMFWCTASASGGTPPHTFQWQGAPQGSTARFFGTCGSMFNLSVSDSAGQSVGKVAAAVC